MAKTPRKAADNEQRKLDLEFCEAWDRARAAGMTLRGTAKAMGYTSAAALCKRRRGVEARLKYKLPPISDRGPQPAKNLPVEVAELPEGDVTLAELLEHRKAQFRRKHEAENARRLIPITVPVEGPYAMWVFGDPHVDDDGTDIETLERHAKTIRETHALYGINAGDTTNNWVGRLARLYGEQGTTAEQSWKLAEWFIGLVGPKWMFMIGGNHDCWSGSGDPIKWIARGHRALYESSEVRVELKPVSGKSIIVNARHDFSGHSQWNPAHGVGKAAQMGVRDDVILCGHKHVTGYMPLKDPDSKKIMHCLQVASYKVYDRYARERGFRDQAISPGAMIVVDPHAETAAGLVHIIHDFDMGVAFLQFLREKYDG